MPPAVSPWPDAVAAFDAWVAADPALPGGDWSRRIAPIGPAEAPLMIVADVPDADDLASGQLLAGPVGALFDAMLAAIGRNRDGLRIASIAATRPPGGQWDHATGQRLKSLTLHNIAISKPRAVLLLGQSTCQLLTGEDVPADGDGLRNINHYGVTTAAVAIHHPRLLLNRAALKRGAWTALKCLRESA